MDISYTATSAIVRKKLGAFDGKTILVVDIDFVNEHGYALAPVKNALVALESKRVEFAWPCDFLPEITPENEKIRNKLEKYADNYPGYGIYNDKELAKMLKEQLE